jgi:hypothetical protein
MDQESIKVLIVLSFLFLFFILALPLKNYLEIKNIQKKDDFWLRWVHELPSKEVYIQKDPLNQDEIKCKYCKATRQYPSLEMVIRCRPTFGIINNTHNKFAHFKTYICTGCGTQMYRERYEE